MLSHIIIDNRTGHAIHAYGCGELFQVQLGSSSRPNPGAAWPACLTVLTIAIGKTSYPQKITASYSSCGGTGNPPLHRCMHGGGAPPLPAGKYYVVFYQSSHLIQAPASIPVLITPRS